MMNVAVLVVCAVISALQLYNGNIVFGLINLVIAIIQVPCIINEWKRR